MDRLAESGICQWNILEDNFFSMFRFVRYWTFRSRHGISKLINHNLNLIGSANITAVATDYMQ